MTRREFLLASAGGLAMALTKERQFQTRGVVLVPSDLSLADWPDRAHRANLTTIALHHSGAPSNVLAYTQSDAGKAFLGKCRRLGLRVEYELHAMHDLLPRDLFEKHPEAFRMNEEGVRTNDSNFCVHSVDALGLVAHNAVDLSTNLKPTTGRYFFWSDDAQGWCRCPKCKDLSDSDQALLAENAILKALKREHGKASLAHLAYAQTLTPPTQVKPEKGIFLEFAPILRRFDIPLDDPLPEQRHFLDALDANLAWFGAKEAQALEYWMDDSKFSGWQRPAKKLPFRPDLCERDLETYASRGIRNVTSFAVFLDADYVTMYGDPPIDEYGDLLYRKMR